MDLRLTPEQEQLTESFAAMLEKFSDSDQVRAAEPLGFDPELWDRLFELGAVAMAVDEGSGGWGASVTELALVAEALGKAAASAPVIEAQVAARLLERLRATDLLDDVLHGRRLVTLALRRAVGSSAELVPAAAVADAALVLRDDELVLVELAERPRHVENLGSMPLADVEVPAGAQVLASGADATGAHEHALDEWLCLTASALVGLARRSLELGVEYVRERRAWGVPIGSFQAVAHPLADAATATDAAGLLAREAAWAAASRPERFGELAAMAFSSAQQSAAEASHRSLHFHGGYGFMMEYDIQLYYRRARGWARVFGGPSAVRRRIADKRYGPAGTSISG